MKLSNKENNNFKEEAKKEKERNVNFSSNDFNNDNNIYDLNKLYRTNKKILTVHANLDLKKKEQNKNESNSSTTNDIKYTQYIFIWETPTKTYIVRMIMPIIIFWSEHIKKNIIAYCNKDLFLFLFQNNFINWDYYVLNYLFSIKAFRQIILRGLSFYYNDNIYNNEKITSFTDRETKNRIFSKIIHKKSYYSSFSYINEKTIILNTNKKIYNQLNQNNESYQFFYTDNFSINSIIEFHSYHIFIENDKLNSKICWEFALNFKQMKYLSNISKYEELESFLPKIIKTNFEDGTLTIDFSVFEYFNDKFLEKKESLGFKTGNSLINLSNNENNTKKRIYNDMILVIKMPFLTVEQFVKSRFLCNHIIKIGLRPNFLNILGNSQIVFWSQKILKIINNKNVQFDSKKSSLNLIKDCYSFNDENKFSNNDYDDDYLNVYHKYKKNSKSLHYKKRRSKID